MKVVQDRYNCVINPRTLICRYCGKHRPHIKNVNRYVCRCSKHPDQDSEESYQCGSILKELFEKDLGISEVTGCSCKDVAHKMDMMGPDWCEENISLLCGQVKENAELMNLPYSKTVCTSLVHLAVDIARSKIDGSTLLQDSYITIRRLGLKTAKQLLARAN